MEVPLNSRVSRGLPVLCAFGLLFSALPGWADSFSVHLSRQMETAEGSGEFKPIRAVEQWKASETAVIVCDMWDYHHCLNATRRVGEMAPRMNRFLEAARTKGVMIIHAPSSCLDFYKDHPARKRAQEAPKTANLPAGINDWLTWIDDREKKAGYPIDDSDGGEDDDPLEHRQWAGQLEKMGRNPRAPWIRQVEALKIDSKKDAITDSGTENWNLLEARGIKNVMLVGVHTNMCVLGRPFGLRQMARNGKNVVLVRDLTDTMYNPAMAPKVSHFEGTDLIIDHVEKYVCPTVTSDQVLGGSPFRFGSDPRPHLVIAMAEKEYETDETLPAFAKDHLQPHFRVTLIHALPENPNHLPGLEALEDADLALISIRRRTLSTDQLALVRSFVMKGKPVIGIRTASHAFSLRGKPAPEGFAAWARFDSEVFGGNYHGHLGNELVAFGGVANKVEHPVLAGISRETFRTGGSLYQVKPLVEGARILLEGWVRDGEKEPIAWTHRTVGGGRAFYTSLGHPDDFRNSTFKQMLLNGLFWAAGLEIPSTGALEEKSAANG